MSVVLGFDYGSKRTGLAIGNLATGTSRALGHVATPLNDDQWRDVQQAVSQWQPGRLLVGTPLTESGERQPLTRKARHFAHQLRDRFGLPVDEVDERYSSTSAEQDLVDARRMGGKKKLKRGDSDALAAALIVQQWLDQQSDQA